MSFLSVIDYDSRGNRLTDSAIHKVEQTGERRIYLRCCETIAAQIESVIGSTRCSRLEMPAHLKGRFTHRLHVDGPIPPAVREFLELLQEVLTLEVRGPLECAIALDFYKDPTSDPDPMRWANTTAGRMVNAGKYSGDVTARNQLIDALADVVRRHPLYRRADMIATVPGHRADVVSFGERIANGVAARVSKPVVLTASAHAMRPAAKQADEQGWPPPDLSDEFTLGPEVHGRVLLIVDDVYKSGRTMRAVAKAARDAGAVAVVGLVGARTLRH